jgi:predicted nucleic acid-binding protein
MDQQDPGALFIAAPTLDEISLGIEKIHEADSAKATELATWMQGLEDAFPVLPSSGEVFALWGKLVHKRSPAHLIDALIAATALENGMTIVTRNTQDFQAFKVPLLNPFDAAR